MLVISSREDVVVNQWEIDRMLCASTAHITRQDNDILESLECSSGIWLDIEVSQTDYGFIVMLGMVHSDDATAEMKADEIEAWCQHFAAEDVSMSQAFVGILRQAFALECRFVRLDRDGPTYEGWERFEW